MIETIREIRRAESNKQSGKENGRALCNATNVEPGISYVGNNESVK